MRYPHINRYEPPNIYDEGEDCPYGWVSHAIKRSSQHIRNQVGIHPGDAMEQKYHEALWQQIAATWFVGSQLQQIADSLENIENTLKEK
mgnify:CR=1 FL=1